MAITNETARNLPETWYYRGFFYLDDYKKNGAPQGQNTSRDISDKSCRKCVEKDNSATKEWAIACEKILSQIAKYHFNDGAKAYQSADYRNAYKEFLLYIEMMKEFDPASLQTTVYPFIGISAFRMDNYLQAVKFLEEARQEGDHSHQTYFYLAKSYWASGERNRAMIVLAEGEKKNPDKVQLIELHLSYLRETGNMSDSEALLLRAIELDPSNIDYLILLAIEYEKFAETFEGEPKYDVSV